MTTTNSLLLASTPSGVVGSFGSTIFSPISGQLAQIGTEAAAGLAALTAFTIANFGVRVITSEAAIDTFRIRVGSANGNGLISVGSGLTGWFTDGSHTDSVSAGQIYNYARSQSGFGNTISIYSAVAQKSSPFVAWAMASGLAVSLSTSTGFSWVFGVFDEEGGESVMQAQVRAAGTWKGLAVRIGGTAPTGTVTFRSRPNTGNGNQIVTAVAPSANTTLQDGSHVDSLSSGDLVAISAISTTAAGNFVALYSEFLGTISAHDLGCTSGSSALGTTLSASTTYFWPFQGTLQAGTAETATSVVMPYGVTVSNFSLNILTNSATTLTARVRKNAGNGNGLISVSSGSTGRFTDGSHVDSFSATDTGNTTGVTGTGSGIRLDSVQVLLDDGSVIPGYTGTIAQTFTGISQAASGGEGFSATIAQTFTGFSQAASGFVKPVGTVDQVFTGFSQAASGGQGVAASVDQVFTGISQSAEGFVRPAGAIAQTFSGMTEHAEGEGQPGNPRATQVVRLVPASGEGNARATQVARLSVSELSVKSRATQIVRLTPASVQVAARSTQAVRLTVATGIPCLTQWCQCWRITREDGQVFRFTSLDEDFAWGAEVFTSCGSLNPSASESASALGSVGNVELTGIIKSDAITAADLYGGLFDDAFVEVWLVAYDDGSTETPKRIAAGWTGQLSQEAEGSFKMEVIGPTARLGQQSLVQNLAPRCRWTFGDDRCGVARAPRALVGCSVMFAKNRGAFTADFALSEIASGDSTGGLSSGLASSEEGSSQWPNGSVLWTSGPNAGQECDLKSVDFDTGEVVLWAVPVHFPEPGDGFELLPGCGQGPEDCKFYDNFDNFGGFPDVPGDDALAQAPDATA